MYIPTFYRGGLKIKFCLIVMLLEKQLVENSVAIELNKIKLNKREEGYNKIKIITLDSEVEIIIRNNY